MTQIISTTDFHFPGQESEHHGKVRDIYDLGDSLLLIASDRYSAFDRNLALVPNKGRLLTQISKWWFEQTKGIIKNHIKSYPDPNVAWCNKYKVVPIEVIVRGYITGVTNTSLWHNYSEGQRDFGDFSLPDGLSKNQRLPKSVLTPTTKLEAHDRPLTSSEVVDEGLVSKELWQHLKEVALKLFEFGQKTASANGLILVDTKYEFGLDDNNQLVLIDEIHTPDSSRYWLLQDYEGKINAGEEPDNYDKEFLRLWYKARFDPYKEDRAPKPDQKIIDELSRRYVYVYEKLTGKKYTVDNTKDPLTRIEANVMAALGESN